MTRLSNLASLVLTLCMIPAFAQAASQFQPLPRPGEATTALQIRVLRYTGGVHGKMIVEVRNAGAAEERFSASGLYFVPEVAPERAPQREGAAGPFEVASTGERARRVSSMAVRPGQTVRLDLQTFCLDSHRASPAPGQAYRVASRRLPPSLRSGIESGTERILSTEGANLESIQQLVWGTRNRSWVPLEGERRDEQRQQGPASAPGGEGGLINL